MNKFVRKSSIALMLLLCAHGAKAIDGGTYLGYAPYTVFGIGDMYSGLPAYNASMGGVGIASRNHRYLNTINPAAITARDSLAFMSDFSIYGQGKTFSQGDMKSANNTLNLSNFAISFPIYHHSAMMVGIRPFSTTGYGYGYYETNPGVIRTVGTTAHAYSGQGGIYQFYVDAGVVLFKRLSLGVEYDRCFGDIIKKYNQTIEDAAAFALSQVSDIYLTSDMFKFGLQFEQHLTDKAILSLGATYRMSSKMTGFNKYTVTTGSLSTVEHTDTLTLNNSPLKIASEMGVGLSFAYGEKFRAEIDYTRSDWCNCGFEKVRGLSVNGDNGPIFQGAVGEKVRAGVEYIPNLSDIRYYFKKVAYRAGVFYGTENYTVYGQKITNFGLTLGMTLPVFRWYNGVTVALEIGQRGTMESNLVRENYAAVSLGFNLFDIWFRKNQYE